MLARANRRLATNRTDDGAQLFDYQNLGLEFETRDVEEDGLAKPRSTLELLARHLNRLADAAALQFSQHEMQGAPFLAQRRLFLSNSQRGIWSREALAAYRADIVLNALRDRFLSLLAPRVGDVFV